MQRNHVALYGIDNYVAAWKLGVYGQFGCAQGLSSYFFKNPERGNECAEQNGN